MQESMARMAGLLSTACMSKYRSLPTVISAAAKHHLYGAVERVPERAAQSAPPCRIPPSCPRSPDANPLAMLRLDPLDTP